MKKLLLILAVFFFTCMSANATVSVRYNNAGQPVSVTYGAGRPMSMAQAAQYSANRRHHHHPRIHRPVPYVGYGFNNGHVGPYVGIKQPITDGNNNRYTVSVGKNISRLSKNYNIPIPAKVRTYGGVTYYY